MREVDRVVLDPDPHGVASGMPVRTGRTDSIDGVVHGVALSRLRPPIARWEAASGNDGRRRLRTQTRACDAAPAPASAPLEADDRRDDLRKENSAGPHHFTVRHPVGVLSETGT